MLEYRFLWVEFQLKAICAQVSDYGIEQTLQHIPPDIDATYERILDMIDRKPLAQRELASKALLFITYAREPVSIDMLALAIATKDHTQTLGMLRSSISTETIILNACGNLLAVGDTDRRARSVHYSVHEFLTSNWTNIHCTLAFEYEVAQREIAQMCMTFLLTLYSHAQADYTALERSFAIRYILPALPHHLLAANLSSLPLNDKIISLTLLFFERGPPLLAQDESDFTLTTFFIFSPATLALIFNVQGTYQCYNPQILHERQSDHTKLDCFSRIYGDSLQAYDDRLAMHYITGQLDSVAVAHRLFTHGYPVDFSFRVPFGVGNGFRMWGQESWIPVVCEFTPLYLVRSEEVARFLLDRGASVNPSLVNDRIPNLVGHVATGGNPKVIQLLLDRGAEQEEEAQCNTLQILAYSGKVEAIRLLLGKGADANAQGGEYGNALHAAALMGQVNAMHLLLDAGADVNAQGGEYGNALQAAATEGQVEAMRVLLHRGANVHAQCGVYGNALQAAAYSGNVEAMQLLLEEGVDVHAKGGEYGNALHGAAYWGWVEAVRLLLNKGADVNAKVGDYGNPLQAAACSGEVEVMQLLLDRGADVHAQVGSYGNVLQAAASWGQVEPVQLLLEKGADIHAQGGRFGNVLQAAAFTGKVDIIKFLLDKGAEIHVQGGYYGNALQAAACRQNAEVVELLHSGADVNAQGGYYGSALQAASHHGNVEIMRLLLDRGADVNAQSGQYGNALQAASWGNRANAKSNVNPMLLLLDKGADINAQGGEYGSALQAAAYHGQVTNVQILLDRGANIHVQGGYYGNALQAAAGTYEQSTEVVQLFLDNGADVNVQGGYYGNALQAAAHNLNSGVMGLLLDRGADVNSPGGKYGNALQAAAHKGNVMGMKLLLHKKADANAKGGMYGNALQAAASRGCVQSLLLLLEEGADVNAQGGLYGTALQAALVEGNHRRYIFDRKKNSLYLAEILLDHGADTMAYVPNSKYGDALTAAKELWRHDKTNFVKFMKLLESKGRKEGESRINKQRV